MGGIKKFKKGEKGENLKYITRNEAVKKLQISLKIFRKLCILKGIHPRDPKKKFKGKHKTYYYSKDIKFLQNEKVLEMIRARKVFRDKEKKLISKKQVGALKVLRDNRPMITLDHIVKERYPTFQDALKDLDDCLSLIYLFANMDASVKVRENQILACEKLAREFQYYVIQSKSLRKVFVSVKGVYYQADIMGETVTWITPLNYLSKKEKEVDYGVMISFLEFYQALMKFVNYRLFTSLGLNYPPIIDEKRLKRCDSIISIFESKYIDGSNKKANTNNKAQEQSNNKNKNDKNKNKNNNNNNNGNIVDSKLKKLEEKISKINSKEEKEIKEPQNVEDTNVFQVNSSGISKDFEDLVGNDESDNIPKIMDITKLFKGFHFFISREVPRHMLEFVILSFGGRVSFEGIGNKVKEVNQSITHQIVDRANTIKTHATREYIQPQWVFDSVNSKILLPYSEYTIGVIPPAHLSPFVEYEEDSYIPARKQALDALINSKEFAEAKINTAASQQDNSDNEYDSKPVNSDGESDDEDDEDLEHLETRYTEELRKEQSKKRKSSDVDGEEEEEEDNEEESGEEESGEEESDEEESDEEVTKPVLTKKQRDELNKQKQAEEDTKLAELMIRKKDKWIYNKVKETNQQKAAANQTLLDKRNKIEAGKDVNGKDKVVPPPPQQQKAQPKQQQQKKSTPQKQQQQQPKKSTPQQPVPKRQKK
ncbi:hypothetical protein ACTA71_000901 [Dictyostelium dimigraforme]